MVFKFVFVIAVACVAQGLAGVPSQRAEVTVEVKPQVQVQTSAELRDDSEIINANYKRVSPLVIMACFAEQKGNYEKLTFRIAYLMLKAIKELAEDLDVKNSRFNERIKVPMQIIFMTAQNFPYRMIDLIKNQQFDKAFELIKKTRKVMEDNFKLIGEATRDLMKELPETAKKAQEKADAIRKEIDTGYAQIRQAFRACVEAGGPKPSSLEDRLVSLILRE